jgi:hypothetical protein
VSLVGLMGCTGWQQMTLEDYRQNGPIVREAWRVTCSDGTIYHGRVQEQSTRETLVLKQGAKEPMVTITIPLSRIEKIEFYRPIY